MSRPPRKVLVIGASGGYGLPSRICAAFAGGAATLGVSYEKAPTTKKPGTAGWYNNLVFEDEARRQGLEARSWNMDAFADAAKDEVIAALRKDGELLDMVIYSLAAPVRLDPDSGELWRSVIMPLGGVFHTKSLDVDKALVIDDLALEPANEEQTKATVKVMGGEDWERWMYRLAGADVLAPGCRALAYTYIGSRMTWPIYWHATLGKAKEDLDRAALAIRTRMADLSGDARVAVLQAVVTQSSAAIPVVPLYISILRQVLQDKDLFEDCGAHIERLFRERLDGDPLRLDDRGRIRVDDIELRPDVQQEVQDLWTRVTTENLDKLTDFAGFRAAFLRLFGFGVPGVDYDADVAPDWRP